MLILAVIPRGSSRATYYSETVGRMSTSSFRIRQAEESDLPQIVAMLSDDPLGSKRERFESPLPSHYYAAFEAIEKDQNNELVG